MTKFGILPDDEVERRRIDSISAMRNRDREEFDIWHQEKMDAFYWKNGPCCAGCDYWVSEMGKMGQCTASPPVSGMEVARSLGLENVTYSVYPDHLYTKMDHSCGKFKDEFDWSILHEDYLKKIGATPNA